MTAFAIMRLLPQVARVTGGEIAVRGRDVMKLKESEMRDLRGGTVGMIFQQARSALNPLMRIETQIARVANAHAPDERRETIRASRRGSSARSACLRGSHARTRTSSAAGWRSAR